MGKLLCIVKVRRLRNVEPIVYNYPLKTTSGVRRVIILADYLTDLGGLMA